MTTEIVKFEFNNQEVDFEQNDQNLMINATQMAKIFGDIDLVNQFMDEGETNDFVYSCLKNISKGFPEATTEDDLFVQRPINNFWMSRFLALRFAAWLDTKFDAQFELWIFATVNDLLFGEWWWDKENLERNTIRRNRIEEIKNELRKQPSALFVELERLQHEDNEAGYLGCNIPAIRRKKIQKLFNQSKTDEIIKS